MMQQGVNQLYERVGRYLAPPIQTDHVILKHRRFPIREGKCSRTGLIGGVVDYVQGTMVLPTLVTTLWVFVTHPLPSKTPGVIKDQRLGGVVSNQIIILTGDKVITNVRFQTAIPNMEVMNTKSIMRLITGGLNDFLFVSFCRSNNRVFGSGLRRSYDVLDVNGDLNIGYQKISNSAVPYRIASEIVETGLSHQQVKDLYTLIVKDELTDHERDRLKKLTKGVPRATQKLLRGATWTDLSLSRLLRIETPDVEDENDGVLSQD
jgi:hypothetical protein